jgi:hypothetical protein
MPSKENYDVWEALGEWARDNLPHGEDYHLPKTDVPHPLDSGFVQHVGLDVGQSADFRRDLGSGIHLHVHEFADTWGLHWDVCAPDEWCHYEHDAPQVGNFIKTVTDD